MADLRKPLSTMNSRQKQILVAAISALLVILIATSFLFPYSSLVFTTGSLNFYYAKATEEGSYGIKEVSYGNKITRVLFATIAQLIFSIGLSFLAFYKVQQDRKRKLI
jgi:hypothetical protein